MSGVRLLTKAQAARYCSLSIATFTRICPMRPINLGYSDPRLIRYDVHDLDRWIDELKSKIKASDESDLDQDDYIEMLDR